MSEAGAARHTDEQEWQRVLRRLRQDSPEQHLPPLGMEVAGYRLEAKLGKGGQGTVFRARREGRLFAVKFIYLPHAARWARRELDVLVKLWLAGGLLLEGHGLWPAQQPLFLFLVTPFVRGRSVDEWAREHNPNALEVAQLVAGAARELEEVHAAGVVHRDVKGANLLIRQEDGKPVLVDFGVATYEGAPEVTGPMPPGTRPYLSPRVWRAWRGEEESPRATPGDDLWALGVEFYELLTGRLPFRGREGSLVQAILHEEPKAPHDLNPRVPRALGEVCQRMLRKKPEERYADARAVGAALEEVLRQADATWEVPLCEAWGPHNATTERKGWMWRERAELVALYERLASYEERPVRGKPRAPHERTTLARSGEEPPGPALTEPPPAGEETEREPKPLAPLEASRDADESREEAPPPEPEMEAAMPSAPPMNGVEVVPPAPAPKMEEPPSARAPDASTTQARAAVGWTAGAVLVLGLSIGFTLCLAPRDAAHITLPGGIPRTTLPPEFYLVHLEPGGQEVAPPWKRPEGDGGTAPQEAETPVPVARATPSKDTRVKTPPKASAPQTQQSKPKETNRSTSMAGALAACTALTGCPSPTVTQVRPSPPLAVECPAEAVKTMKELGLQFGPWDNARVQTPRTNERYITVRPGPGATMELTGEPFWGKLPEGTLFTGEWLFGEERVFGRFTQAHTPNGHTYPVCMELWAGPEKGLEKRPGSGQDTAKVHSSGFMEAVESFK